MSGTVRPNGLTEISTPASGDGFVVGGASRDAWWPVTALISYLEDIAMTMTGKTLTGPVINGMTTETTTKITSLNADKVDDCDVGSGDGNLARLCNGAVAGRLDLNLLGKALEEFTRVQYGPSSHVKEVTGGTVYLTMADAGKVILNLTSAATIYLPSDAVEANAGAAFLIKHASGVFNAAINAPGTHKLQLFKDDLSETTFSALNLNTVGGSILVYWDGTELWMIATGHAVTA